MTELKVDFSAFAGKMKPMHAVNNGPVYKFAEDQRISNLDAFVQAGIPYARTHDASFCSSYGGEHTVDVKAIFPDFDADPMDPASYDFVLTDEYLQVMQLAGVKPFYRLGCKIEHWKKKYGTLPPKDFHKWAVICEHIIRHYTQGWADGFKMDIPYWEIWNEPDLDPDDSTNKRCWGGTKKEFFSLYHIAATHLKACFPMLYIGGPALAGDTAWMRDFLAQLKAPLDFFSWHIYADDPVKIEQRVKEIRGILDEYGFSQTQSILNEWNYVKGWTGEQWLQSLRAEKSLTGAAFIAGTMCLCQYAPLHMLMYYDARPCGMNGMFNTDLVCECLKGYYPFVMFRRLYDLQESFAVSSADPQIQLAAAKKDDSAAVLLSYFSDDPQAQNKTVQLHIAGFAGEPAVKAAYEVLDETHDMQTVREEFFAGEAYAPVLTLTPNCVYLLRLSR